MSIYKHVSGNGPTLVLLHGWGTSSAVWKNLIPLLATRFQVIAIDLPGFGQSEWDSNIDSLALLSEAILAILPENSIFLGWSLGGLIAQYIAIHHPHRVSSLISVTSTPCFIDKSDWPGIHEFLLNKFAEDLKIDYQKTLTRFFTLMQFAAPSPDKNLIKFLSETLIEHPPKIEALEFGLNLLLHTDLRSELYKIQCPMKFILGQLDTIVPARIAEPLQQLAPEVSIEILPKSSHAPFLSDPENFLTATGLINE